MDRLQSHRDFFADLITSSAGVPKSESPLRAAFATIPRERFLGPGPWKVSTFNGYVETPSDDPAFLYQDVVVALDSDRGINNGQPTLHAACLSALNPQPGETIVHIGAGMGYYTAILSMLTSPTGSVLAYEIDKALAQCAARNLSELSNITVFDRSGSEGVIPTCDAIYVSAGATEPLDIWLDALRLGGRLIFPLTPAEGPNGASNPGGMLLLTKAGADSFHARFVCSAIFIPCVGARNDDTASKLSEAFRRGNSASVRSLRRNTPPDETSWFSAPHWWLSTSKLTS
ncbi:MAG: methyltransferase [Candidatus Acidiferrum sp.]